MQITPEQLHAIDSGQPVPLTVDGRDCVLVPESLYEQLREAIDDWHPATMRRNMAEMMKEDWTDPSLGVYDE